jgi:N-acetylmuramoyl-L-alanine amidase
MNYTNSSLVEYVDLSPNCTYPRRDTIKKITIHHMKGNISVEQCGKIFSSKSRKASSNYGIDSSGKIAMYVPEESRAWTSSNQANDHQAITIEVANIEYKYPWKVSDIALSRLVELCVDICKRNNIKELKFTWGTWGNLTAHRFFTSTDCPGQYLYSKFPYIAEEVNKRLVKKYYKIQVMTLDNLDDAERVRQKLISLGYNDTAIIEFEEY